MLNDRYYGLAVLALVCGVLAACGRQDAEPGAQPTAPEQEAPPSAGADVAEPGSEHVVSTEPVQGSSIPVHLMYVETWDGLYTAIGVRKPDGEGPFPMILFTSGNGGGGMPWVRDATQNQSWTLEQFLAAGYAVAWTRYRSEVELGYNTGGKLVKDVRQGRTLFNRSPLDFEDVIAIADFVKTLPYVDADRVGYVGMSHGGEMALKITSQYGGLRAAVASEPASHEFLALQPDETASVNPESGLRNLEEMDMSDVQNVMQRIDEQLASERVSTIETPIFVHGRDEDHLQGIFRATYEVLREGGADAHWVSYDHPEHGFLYVDRTESGVYDPDPVQVEAVQDSIAWLDEQMR